MKKKGRRIQLYGPPHKKGDWMDADHIMFHACFAILGDFVEKELGSRPWSEDKTRDMYRGYRVHSAEGTDEKAIDLWLWYRDEYPRICEEYNKDQDAYVGTLSMTREPIADGGRLEGAVRVSISRTGSYERKFSHDYLDSLEDQKLRELIDLRTALWT